MFQAKLYWVLDLSLNMGMKRAHKKCCLPGLTSETVNFIVSSGRQHCLRPRIYGMNFIRSLVTYAQNYQVKSEMAESYQYLFTGFRWFSRSTLESIFPYRPIRYTSFVQEAILRFICKPILHAAGCCSHFSACMWQPFQNRPPSISKKAIKV